MTRYHFLAAAAGAVILTGIITLAVSHAGQDGPAAPSNSVQVKDLLRRIEKLEARVAELERRVPRVVVPAEGAPQLRIIPEGKFEGRPLPKGWIPREFNGLRYYDVPLGKAPPSK